jgi:iron(III) transport system ATP-binding protein
MSASTVAGPTPDGPRAQPAAPRPGPDGPTSAVTVRGVWKSYGAHSVLRGVDLDVSEGGVTAVLGASGCGKTTLLRLLAGFDTADSGSIALHRQVVDDGRRAQAPQRRRVGFVPQDGGLFPHLSVAANVGFGLPRQQRRARVRELLEMVGLPDLADRAPHQLSGGQQQRVALARALAARPALVLLDEPFSALDAALRSQLRDDVVAVLHASATTAVLVTHDQDEALSTADHVAVMRDGQIAQTASPAVLYRQPVDAGVARFIGAANLLPGRVQGRTATCVLGALPLLDDTPRLPTDALIMIRPEQLRLTPTDRTAGHVDREPTGRIVRREYHGHDTVLTVELHTSHVDAISDAGTRPRLIARISATVLPDDLVTIAVEGPVVALPTQPQLTTDR